MYEFMDANSSYLIIAGIVGGLIVYFISIIYLLKRTVRTLSWDLKYTISIQISEQINRQDLMLKKHTESLQGVSISLAHFDDSINQKANGFLAEYKNSLLADLSKVEHTFLLHSEAINSYFDDLSKTYEKLIDKSNTVLSLQAKIEKYNAIDRRKQND